MNDPSQPIRIFIGSSPKNSIEERVFRYTLQKCTQSAIEIHIIDGQAGTSKCLDTGDVKQLPMNIISRIKGATAFSLARWAIPQWCDYQGKAIYCDSDQIALSDLSELWNYDLAESTIAAVSVRKARSSQHYVKHFLKSFLKTNDECYLASVMLIDCEKAACWSIESLIDIIDRNQFTLPELMYLRSSVRNYFNLTVSELPSVWNHLDGVDSDSRIVHFTDLTSQPWRFHHNPVSTLWEQYFLEAVAQGFVTKEDLETAYSQGWISKRIKALPFMDAGVRQPLNRLWRSWNAFFFLIGQFFRDQVKLLRLAAYKLRVGLGIIKGAGT